MEGTVTLFPWFALEITRRQEKCVERLLRCRGYDPFLPQNETLRSRADRMAKVMLPLFPGYLFCRFDPVHRLPILTTPGVYRMVSTAQGPTPVDETELDNLRSVIAAKADCRPWPYVDVGRQRRIVSGPLRGLQGIPAEHTRKCRLILSVTLLRRAIALELDMSAVEPVATPRPRLSAPARTGFPATASSNRLSGSSWRLVDGTPPVESQK
jgi:transcriptional antiterminator NusG